MLDVVAMDDVNIVEVQTLQRLPDGCGDPLGAEIELLFSVSPAFRSDYKLVSWDVLECAPEHLLERQRNTSHRGFGGLVGADGGGAQVRGIRS